MKKLEIGQRVKVNCGSGYIIAEIAAIKDGYFFLRTKGLSNDLGYILARFKASDLEPLKGRPRKSLFSYYK